MLVLQCLKEQDYEQEVVAQEMHLSEKSAWSQRGNCAH